MSNLLKVMCVLWLAGMMETCQHSAPEPAGWCSLGAAAAAYKGRPKRQVVRAGLRGGCEAPPGWLRGVLDGKISLNLRGVRDNLLFDGTVSAEEKNTLLWAAANEGRTADVEQLLNSGVRATAIDFR